MKDQPDNNIPDEEFQDIKKFLYKSISTIDRRDTAGRAHERQVIQDIYNFIIKTRTNKRIDILGYSQPTDKHIYIISTFMRGLPLKLIATMLDLHIDHVNLFYSVTIEYIAVQMLQQSITQVSK